MGVEESGGHSATVLCARVEAREASWNASIDAVRAAIERAQTAVRGAVEANGGRDLDAAGTSISAAFASAGQAFAAAVDAQLALADGDWGEAGAVRAAIVVHATAGAATGDATAAHADSAARLLEAVHPGQIVLTERVADLARPDLITGMELRPLGSGQVGAERLRLWQLTLPGARKEFPALTLPPTEADPAAVVRLRRETVVPAQPAADESERAALRLRGQPALPVVNLPPPEPAPDVAATAELSLVGTRRAPEDKNRPLAGVHPIGTASTSTRRVSSAPPR